MKYELEDKDRQAKLESLYILLLCTLVAGLLFAEFARAFGVL